MGWETFQFGRLYLDAESQHIPVTPTDEGDVPDYKEGQVIDIMRTSKEHSITWVKPDGINLFVADRVLLKNVSWKNLKATGFIDGKTVGIGEKRYRCRLLQVGDNKNGPNEWDSILDTTTEDNDLWHWTDMYFWGIDTPTDSVSSCVVRGWVAARFRGHHNATYRHANVGFRPALEPLLSDTLDSDTLITLEGQKFVMSQLQGTNGSMFYPTLAAIGTRLFSDIPNGEKITMYTALLNGNPVRTDLDKPESMLQDAQITLTDKFYGEEFLIPWVVSNGVAVAGKALLKKEV